VLNPCPPTWKTGRRLPQAVTRCGDKIYVSGFPPFDPDTTKVIEAPIERQTELVLEQMKLCLETAGIIFGKRTQMQCVLLVGR
jgi:enamine deaminase RidA (YjgF/YER057c/UK114 family)